MRKRKEFLEIGKIVAPHGVRGHVRVQPWCDDAELLTEFDTLYFDEGKTPVQITASSLHKNVVLLKLVGIDDMNAAQELRNKILYVPREELQLDERTYFVQDLIGMQVVDADDNSIVYGKLNDVMSTGANDVYEIMTPAHRKVLIPAIKDVIVQTDLDADTMFIRPLKGLFEE